MQEDLSCYICSKGFVHVRWNDEEYILSREIGWLSSDEFYSNYHPVYHPCVNCNKQNDLCSPESIIMEFVNRFIAVGLYYSKEEFGEAPQLLSQWILKLKRDPTYADPLGCALAEVINKYWMEMLTNECREIVIIPVPKHTDEGEYNQALELAKAMVKRLEIRNLNVNLEPSLVVKKSPMKASERRKKCENKCKADIECLAKCNFDEESRILEVNKKFKNIRNLCAIVIDDVRTTGATIGAIAKSLKESGVDKVFAATLARNAIKRELLKCVAPHIWERHEYFMIDHENK